MDTIFLKDSIPNQKDKSCIFVNEFNILLL